MVELDLENGKIKVREDLEYEFKELVTRKEMKKIRELRKKHSDLEEKGIENLTPEDEEKLEDEWFNTVLPLGLKNFNKDDLDNLTEGELRELSASTFVFLQRFGSTALAKQFALQQKEIQQNDQKQ